MNLKSNLKNLIKSSIENQTWEIKIKNLKRIPNKRKILLHLQFTQRSSTLFFIIFLYHIF